MANNSKITIRHLNGQEEIVYAEKLVAENMTYYIYIVGEGGQKDKHIYIPFMHVKRITEDE